MSRCGKFILKKPLMHRLILSLTAFFIFFLTNQCDAQNSQDTLSEHIVNVPDTLALKADTSTVPLSDSATIATLEDSLGIRISKEGLNAVVTAEATDSAVLNLKENLFYLYGDAKVNYEDL